MPASTIRCILVCVLMSTSVFALPRLPEFDLEMLLRSSHYDPNDLESVIAAAHDESYPTRWIACQLLSYRPGEKSVATLKDALRDPELRVRMGAAQALLAMSDRSGSNQVLEDWEELVPQDTEQDPACMAQMDAYRLSQALEVGLVLAESGSGRALPLAEFAAEQSALAYIRHEAVDLLCAGLKLDKRELGKSGVDPSLVLRRVSASERENTVLGVIYSRLEKVPPEAAVPILSVLVKSPHLTGNSKGAAQSVLKRKEAEARGEAWATQPAGARTTIIDLRPATRPAQTQPR